MERRAATGGRAAAGGGPPIGVVPARSIALAVAILVAPLPCRGDAVPAAIFGDSMVLERDVPLPVWGTARPGEPVVVTFGAAEGATVADGAGRWRVELPPRPASFVPADLVIRGDRERRVEDVLVGEVWLCAGQSNMLMPLAKVDDAAREIAAASLPAVRLCRCRTAAGGDRPAYSPAEIAGLAPDRFMAVSWSRSTPETAAEFSAVAFFLGRGLAESVDVPVGVICLAVGGSPTEAWIRREALAGDAAVRTLAEDAWLDDPLVAAWCRTRARDNLGGALAAGTPVPGDALGPNHPFKPGFLWEAGVARLAPFAIRGVAWYQGESNAETPELVAVHDHLFPILVGDWRRAWGRDDLPFAVVQLPGMDRPHWPAFRESQRRLQRRLDHVGLIVTIDLGRPDDVHPGDKRPLGERLAAWATAETRGWPAGAGGSPLPSRAEFRDDGTVVVQFEGASTLRTNDGEPPRLFELGREGRFWPARAVVDGTTVTLASDASPGPWDEVRYAWLPCPRNAVNLVDPTGLPAAPFSMRRSP